MHYAMVIFFQLKENEDFFCSLSQNVFFKTMNDLVLVMYSKFIFETYIFCKFSEVILLD